MISASSGTVNPQYNFVNSFKLFDPTSVKMSHHFEDSHARRAEHDQYASAISATITDLIHDGVVVDGEDFWEMEPDELLDSLAIEMFYMQPLLDDTHSFLSQMAGHFQMITENMNEVELYDHSVHLNQDLFQVYFNMSIGLATELNYLEEKDDDLDRMLEEQVASG